MPTKSPRACSTHEAAFCAAMTYLESCNLIADFEATTDWVEVGMTKDEVRALWAKHKKHDKDRRLREKALSKLTEAERNALGV